MIEQEFLEIVHSSDDRGRLLNSIADQFREGRDVHEILVLLDSTNPELVSIGAWILGELRLELYNCDSFLSRLQRLVEHEDPSVRFHVLGALFPMLSWQDDDARQLISKLRNDPNEGVRRSADAMAARLPSLGSSPIER